MAKLNTMIGVVSSITVAAILLHSAILYIADHIEEPGYFYFRVASQVDRHPQLRDLVAECMEDGFLSRYEGFLIQRKIDRIEHEQEIARLQEVLD